MQNKLIVWLSSAGALIALAGAPELVKAHWVFSNAIAWWSSNASYATITHSTGGQPNRQAFVQSFRLSTQISMITTDGGEIWDGTDCVPADPNATDYWVTAGPSIIGRVGSISSFCRLSTDIAAYAYGGLAEPGT
jgi:hypothetical protein